jgi:hypothetical protein
MVQTTLKNKNTLLFLSGYFVAAKPTQKFQLLKKPQNDHGRTVNNEKRTKVKQNSYRQLLRNKTINKFQKSFQPQNKEN